jgi:hypothetical protein
MKKSNEYAQLIDPRVFEKVPKTVLAAIAVSLQAKLGVDGDWNAESVTKALRKEWTTLYQNGIVPQKPLA